MLGSTQARLTHAGLFNNQFWRNVPMPVGAHFGAPHNCGFPWWIKYLPPDHIMKPVSMLMNGVGLASFAVDAAQGFPVLKSLKTNLSKYTIGSEIKNGFPTTRNFLGYFFNKTEKPKSFLRRLFSKA